MTKRHIYSEINLHIVWHVKNSQPVLSESIEDRVHHFLKHYVLEAPGVLFHEIGGTATHVHLAISIPPTLLISDWIGKLKGASSHHINSRIANRKVLDWQEGYGVVSFGTRELEWVKEYIRNQKAHHAHAGTHERLETIWLKPDEEGR